MTILRLFHDTHTVSKSDVDHVLGLDFHDIDLDALGDALWHLHQVPSESKACMAALRATQPLDLGPQEPLILGKRTRKTVDEKEKEEQQRLSKVTAKKQKSESKKVAENNEEKGGGKKKDAKTKVKEQPVSTRILETKDEKRLKANTGKRANYRKKKNEQMLSDYPTVVSDLKKKTEEVNTLYEKVSTLTASKYEAREKTDADKRKDRERKREAHEELMEEMLRESEMNGLRHKTDMEMMDFTGEKALKAIKQSSLVEVTTHTARRNGIEHVTLHNILADGVKQGARSLGETAYYARSKGGIDGANMIVSAAAEDQENIQNVASMVGGSSLYL